MGGDALTNHIDYLLMNASTPIPHDKMNIKRVVWMHEVCCTRQGNRTSVVTRFSVNYAQGVTLCVMQL